MNHASRQLQRYGSRFQARTCAVAFVVLLGSSYSGVIDAQARPASPVDVSPGISEQRTESDSQPAVLDRFVVKVRNEQQGSELSRALAERFGAETKVVSLFDNVDSANDPDGMRLMYRVAIPKRSLPSDNAWQNAYWLEEQLGLEQVEPDAETTLENTLEMAQICLVETPPPVDKTWSLLTIRAPAAWQLVPPTKGKRYGEGIDVCHPDTGWTGHIDLDASQLDLSRARNLLGSGASNGEDPLEDGLLLNPGHGTGTGSVIVSGHQSGEIKGVAPKARLVPIRTAKSVIQLFDSDLARAVNYSVDAGCDVISMSLGGRAFFGLNAAIRRAVRNQLIVAAAAGNCVGFVVAPAAYDETIAVGGTNINDSPWKGTSRGQAVDVSAPAEQVWVARRRKASDGPAETAAGQGTSYAVANVAGGAALWLAFHGRDALIEKYSPTNTLQNVFRETLGQSARVPEGWRPGQLGAGVLDLEALLKASLPPPSELESGALEGATQELETLSSVLGRNPQELAPILATLFGVSVSDVESRLKQFGPELIHIALSDPNGFRRLLDSVDGVESGAMDDVPNQASMRQASENLQRAIDRQ